MTQFKNLTLLNMAQFKGLEPRTLSLGCHITTTAPPPYPILKSIFRCLQNQSTSVKLKKVQNSFTCDRQILCIDWWQNRWRRLFPTGGLFRCQRTGRASNPWSRIASPICRSLSLGNSTTSLPTLGAAQLNLADYSVWKLNRLCSTFCNKITD